MRVSPAVYNRGGAKQLVNLRPSVTSRPIPQAHVWGKRSDMIVSLLQGAVICSVLWFLWRLSRQIVVKSPLDNVPGLPSPSFLYGSPHAFCLAPDVHRTLTESA